MVNLLSDGLGQHDSFDMKPEAPEGMRGEFQSIDTAGLSRTLDDDGLSPLPNGHESHGIRDLCIG
jgi:hypothetical protein